MNGIAGVVYAAEDIDRVFPGTGLFGGDGEVPVGGVIAEGQIGSLIATDSTLSGPIMSGEGTNLILARRTMVDEAKIGAGADNSDWAHWDQFRSTTHGMRLNRMIVVGSGSGLEDSALQVGVLNSLVVNAPNSGVIATDIWALGDLETEEGINRIRVVNGDIDGTDDAPYGGLGGDFRTTQRIGTIAVAGSGDIINLDARAEKTIDRIAVSGTITSNTDTSISAPLGIRRIVAREISGGGSITFGTGELDALIVTGDVSATMFTSGKVDLMRVGGAMSAQFEVTGASGTTERLIVGNGVTATGGLVSSNTFGDIRILSGDLAGDVLAGGSDGVFRAIRSLRVLNGDLSGDVTVQANESAVLPGGGIGTLSVNGDLTGEVTTASFVDPATGENITGELGRGLLRGNLDGDLNIDGGIGRLQVIGGIVTDNGTGDPRINATGNVDFLQIVGPGGTAAVEDDLSVGGDLDFLLVVSGDFEGGLDVSGRVGKALFTASSDMVGDIDAGEAGNLFFFGPGGVLAGVSTDGVIGRLLTLNGISGTGSITSGGGIDTLQSFEDAAGAVTVTGGDVGFAQILGALNAPLDVEDGSVGRLVINNGGAAAVNETIDVAQRVSRMDVTGEVTADIEIGSNQPEQGADTVIIRGNLDAEFDVLGDVGTMRILGGQITDNGAPGEARVEITGNVDSLQISGFAGAGAAINDDLQIGGALAHFLLRNGDFDGDLEAGTMGRIFFSNPGGIWGDVTSNGDIDLLQSRGAIGQPGGSNAEISAFNHIGSIQALGGITSTGSVSAGTAGVTDGGIDRVRVLEGLGGQIQTLSGGLDTVDVRGDMAEALIDVAENLETVSLAGNFADSNIDAGTLGRVTVRGAMSGTPAQHQIHAQSGTFTLRVSGVSFTIPPEQTIGGVRAFVG